MVCLWGADVTDTHVSSSHFGMKISVFSSLHHVQAIKICQLIAGKNRFESLNEMKRAQERNFRAKAGGANVSVIVTSPQEMYDRKESLLTEKRNNRLDDSKIVIDFF